MPRYFFHLFEDNTQNLVRDPQGISLADAGAAKKEAIGLAQDIVQHGFFGSTWQVIVTDANSAIVLQLPLLEVRPCKMKPWLDLARRVATYEPKLRPHIFTWLLTVAIFALIMQTATLTGVSRSTPEATGSLGVVPKETILEARFASWTSLYRHPCHR